MTPGGMSDFCLVAERLAMVVRTGRPTPIWRNALDGLAKRLLEQPVAKIPGRSVRSLKLMGIFLAFPWLKTILGGGPRLSKRAPEVPGNGLGRAFGVFLSRFTFVLLSESRPAARWES